MIKQETGGFKFIKIALLEPLGISEEKLSELSGKLKSQGNEFVSFDSVSDDPAELSKRAQDADILMIANHPLPGEVIRSDEKLKFVSVAFVGIDHVDTEACKERGIPISNTGGYCTDAVAELALGLTLDLLRNISECDKAVQGGLGKGTLAGNELAGKTVGIIGTGQIGLRAAELFKAFRCNVCAFSRHVKQEAQDLGIEMLSLPELLSRSDIVSIHTPLTASTKGLIGEKELGMMKPGAILINTACGPIVDSEALSKALKAGKIRAGVDVYEKDPPLSAGHPLLGVPNLVCTPHVGFDTKESIERRAEMAFENVLAYIAGNPVRLCGN